MTKPFAMVVDDDKTLRTLLFDALEMCGFEVDPVADGQEVFDHLINRYPRSIDLVILDMQMPHVTGGEILRQLRADERFAKLKVVILTANPHTLLGTNLADIADLVLSKPVTIDQIRDFAQRLVPSLKSGEN